MAVFEKYKRSQVGFVFAHAYRRSTPRDGHIDKSLSDQNSWYMRRDSKYFYDRLEELNCCKRDDVNVLAELIVTKPKDFNGTSEEFFQAVYDFCRLTYKEDNIIYATGQRDEPRAEDHIHIGFIPTVWDAKKKKAVVSYDKAVHRKLDSFHPKLSEYCEKRFGHDIGIINGATREGNKTPEQLKQEEELRKDIERIKAEKEEILRQKQEALTLDARIMLAEKDKQIKHWQGLYNGLVRFIRESKLVELYEKWAKQFIQNRQKER